MDVESAEQATDVAAFTTGSTEFVFDDKHLLSAYTEARSEYTSCLRWSAYMSFTIIDKRTRLGSEQRPTLITDNTLREAGLLVFLHRRAC